jgi:putative ABC transport system permease protein
VGLAIGMATFLITSLYCINEWSFDKQHPGWENIFRYVHRVKSGDELQSFAFTSATTGPALKERYTEVEDFTRVFQIEVSLKSKDSDVGFVEKRFAFADANFLNFFSFQLRNGNDPKILNEPYSIILAPGAAQKYFGDVDPVGKMLLLNGQIELKVRDVFKNDFSHSHMRFDFVASFATLEAIKNHAIVSKQIPASLNLEHKGFNAFYTYLRLTSIHASESLQRKLPAYIEEFRGKGRSERLKPALQSLASIHLHSDIRYEIDKNGSHAIVLIYSIVGGLILLISIINYINISTAEFFLRAKNIGLKKILGIDKGPLLLGHIVETMVLCAIAILSGSVLSILLLPLFNDIMQTQITFFSQEVALPLIVVYSTTVLLSGLLPCIQIFRQNALNAFHGNLKGDKSSSYVRNSLVFLQLMTSFVLLAIALLIVRQTDYLLERNTGFDADQVMVVNTAGMTPNERMTFKHKLMAQQDVSRVSLCSTPPGESLFTFGLTLPGANGDEDRRITFYHLFVDENFLDALGIKLKEGRFFQEHFPGDSLNSFIVNQTGAEAITDSLLRNPIEIPNIYTGKASRKNVVGVIDDFHFTSFHTAVEPLIMEYNPNYATYLLVRFDPAKAKSVIEILDRTWKTDAPLLPLNYYFLDESFATHYATEQRTKQIVIIVSILAICLASLGIFGTSLFVLQQRTREIGVRKLLGSATHELFITLFKPIFLIFFAASAVGIPLTIWFGEEWLARYPYRTDFSISILIISFIIILAVMIVTVGSYLMKIIRVQPAEVLRSQ